MGKTEVNVLKSSLRKILMYSLLRPYILGSSFAILLFYPWIGGTVDAADEGSESLYELCDRNKREIESLSDDQFYRRDIAYAHFDNLIKQIDKGAPQHILMNLHRRAFESKQVFESGRCPDFPGGKTEVKFRRFVGGQLNRFTVTLPDDYDPDVPLPIVVQAAKSAGTAYDFSKGVIDIRWSWAGEPCWEDFTAFMDILKSVLAIDGERMYLRAACEDGITGMKLALKHPDYWAEVGIHVGNSLRYFAGNAYNLPLIFCRGPYMEGDTGAYYDFAANCFKYKGCDVALSERSCSTIEQIRGRDVPVSVKCYSPDRVVFGSDSLSDGRAYWLNIDSRKNENFTAYIDANVVENTIYIKTENIDSYSLDIKSSSADLSKQVTIVENGDKSYTCDKDVFKRESELFKNAMLIKNAEICGPVSDIFSEPYIVVWGENGRDQDAILCGRECAELFSNGAPVFSDSNMPTESSVSKNLVLVGTEKTNSLVKKFLTNLPVNLTETAIEANGVAVNSHDRGMIAIYPHPDNSRYIAIFYGNTSRALKALPRAYEAMKQLRSADIGVFSLGDKEGEFKWHILERFDSSWNWHQEFSTKLCTVQAEFADTAWRLWAAAVMRQMTDADIAIAGDIFMPGSEKLSGTVTFRDVFNRFRNEWILTIRVKGSDLRDYFVQQVSNVLEKKTEDIAIAGFQFYESKKSASKELLTSAGIEPDSYYKVTIFEHLLNGAKPGAVLNNYEITDDSFLIQILYDYLRSKGFADMDDEVKNSWNGQY